MPNSFQIISLRTFFEISIYCGVESRVLGSSSLGLYPLVDGRKLSVKRNKGKNGEKRVYLKF